MSNRLECERRHHDLQAAERAVAFRTGRAELRFEDAAYLDHETWIRPAFAKLGDLRDKCVLDYGCGHGMAAVVLARAGATVTAMDLSSGYVKEARERAVANAVDIACVTAAGESLPFDDASFDAVWGCAILHHLELGPAARELARVLKPGGTAVFCEPWAGNPLLQFARARLPYPGKDRTADEQPLRGRDLQPLREAFPSLQLQGFQLLGMVRRLWGNPAVVKRCDAIDRRLLRWRPRLGNLCRYVVLTLRKGYT